MIDLMKDPKTTKLNIREDRPTAISSSMQKANLDALGFNIAFLAARSPRLAVEIMKLYALAHKVDEDDPTAPDEDMAMYAEEVAKILSDSE